MRGKWWKYGAPFKMTIIEERTDLMNMLTYAICDVDDADAIKAVINGLRSYYQQKYLINKDEYESEIKAMEEAEILKD